MNAQSGTAEAESARKTRMMLWVLMIIYILNFLDRQIVNILAEPISKSLDLSDTQIGLLTGLAFALFYTILGIPIARYADSIRSNRVTIISTSLAIWSGFTALSGSVQNFTQMLLVRMGVGVGEAGCTPAAMSLITDSVPPEKRGSAIGFYGLGVPIGSMLGAAGGGLLSDAFGWRTAFLVVGIPGVLLALALPFIIREPRRAPGFQANAKPAPVVPVLKALAEIARSPAFILIMIASSLTAFLGYGKTTWAGIYFIRVRGLTPGEVGLILGVLLGFAGAMGTWGGGKLADVLGRKDKAWITRAPAIGMLIGAPLLFLGYWVDDWRMAVALLFIPSAMNMLYYGPTYMCVQSLVRPELRATATSIMIFAQNLVGLGLGPTVFGFMSDWLKPSYGTMSVQIVLWSACWLALIPAVLFWRAGKHLRTEMAKP